MNLNKQFLCCILSLSIVFLFVECNQHKPLKIVMYNNEISGSSVINKMDKNDSSTLANIFDSLKYSLKIKEFGFHSFNLRQTPGFIFSYCGNGCLKPIYLPKPAFDEIFLLQYAAMKDLDDLFTPIEKHGKITESIVNVFDHNYSEDYRRFKDIFNVDDIFLKDTLQLKNTTIEERRDSKQFIKTNSKDLIKLLGLSYNGVIGGLENLNKAYILKYRHEEIMPISNWFIQNYFGIKLYWSSYSIADNKIFFLFIPAFTNGVLFYETERGSCDFGTNEEGDITYNPFISQWMIMILKDLKVIAINDIINDLRIKASIGKARKLNKSEEKEIINDKIEPFYNIKTPTACINYVENNYYGKRSFYLEKETKIRIKAIGEGNTIIDDDKDLDREHIEFVFDMKNGKNGPIDVKNFDRQFRISFMDSAIYGIYKTRKRIFYKYFFEDNHHYNLEAYFPWDVLGYIKPKDGVKFGFDVSISDNDGEGREKKISWHSKNDSVLYNTAFMGNIKLKNNANPNEKVLFLIACYTNQTPCIDGKEDECWKKAVLSDINNVVLGTRDNKNDIKGSFRVLWDKSGLYFLVHITDDYINFNSTIKSIYKDYGWIESIDTHEIVWSMKKTRCRPVGKEKVNMFCDTTILIPKGKYNLVYISDDSHAYMNWFKSDEYLPFYGIKVFREDK